MTNLIYDGTFEGLLTAVFYGYSYKDTVNIVSYNEYIPSLIDDVIEIKTELDKFTRVYNSIKEKLNASVLRNVYYLYLCGIPDSKTLVLDYLKLCYKLGSKVNLAKNNTTIILVDKYCRKVTGEAHNFKGFVRFKEISPLNYYSSIEPDHNILPLLMDHFQKRFSDQNFIIHDLKREIAIFYNKESSIITDFKKIQAENLLNSNSDKKFSSLWKTFYNSVNIEERKNLKLRKQHMPKRYWNHLTELK